MFGPVQPAGMYMVNGCTVTDMVNGLPFQGQFAVTCDGHFGTVCPVRVFRAVEGIGSTLLEHVMRFEWC